MGKLLETFCLGMRIGDVACPDDEDSLSQMEEIALSYVVVKRFMGTGRVHLYQRLVALSDMQAARHPWPDDLCAMG